MIRARAKQYGSFANYRDYPQIFSIFERLLRLSASVRSLPLHSYSDLTLSAKT
jgi:hypothetical protein